MSDHGGHGGHESGGHGGGNKEAGFFEMLKAPVNMAGITTRREFLFAVGALAYQFLANPIEKILGVQKGGGGGGGKADHGHH